MDVYTQDKLVHTSSRSFQLKCFDENSQFFFCDPRYRTSGNYSSTISGRKEQFRQRKQYAGSFPKMSLLMTHSFITFYCFHCRFKSAQFLSNGGPDFVSQYHCDSDPGDFRMFSTRLPLFRQKRPMTFPDEIASNMSNKCTFITPNSLWTSRMKNELQCNKVQVSYFIELPQSNSPDYTNSLNFLWLRPNSPTISRFQDIPKKWKPCFNNRWPISGNFFGLRLRNAFVFNLRTTRGNREDDGGRRWLSWESAPCGWSGQSTCSRGWRTAVDTAASNRAPQQRREARRIFACIHTTICHHCFTSSEYSLPTTQFTKTDWLIEV